MLAEPAASLTDLALGLVALYLALRLRGGRDAQRYWMLAFAWTAAAALSGAVHHAWIVEAPTRADASWAVISGMVVVAISYILAASVLDVLGPGRWRVFWVIRIGTLLAYAGVALSGNAGIEGILACEGATMLIVLGLWGVGLRRGNPRAAGVIGAIAVSIVAACMKALPTDDLPVGFDRNALYHLVQIPGLVLLYLAARDRPSEAPAEAPTLGLDPQAGGFGVPAGPGGGR